MIAIIDYGVGNLASVANAFAKLGLKTCITSDPNRVLEADQVILPGVGAFADAMQSLKETGLNLVIPEIVKRHIPLLGICLGMQLLLTSSMENGLSRGLDIVKGQVVKFPPLHKVPHMGWNEVVPSGASRLFQGIKPGSYFYFVHSYYTVVDDPSWTAATSDYGLTFTCALEKDNVFATQFHPEKSSAAGLKVLKNFGEIKK